MIDLHCHLLPGIDDGAPDLATSLAMARIAVDDGIRLIACTPHQMPGYYENKAADIRQAVTELQAQLDAAGIPLRLTTGADVHLVPDMAAGLSEGRLLTLAGGRYFLFEPPHNTAPPRLAEVVFETMAAGFHPIITHPERLRWIEDHYDTLTLLAKSGAWMQLTAGSITGRFGKRAQYWSERMLDEGLVHLIASDAHNLRARVPKLSTAVEMVADRLGDQAAYDMVVTRAKAVIQNASPSDCPPPVGRRPAKRSLLSGLFGMRG